MGTGISGGATAALIASLPLAAASAQQAANGPLLHGALAAPDDIVITGSLRGRYETLDGQSRAGFGASDRLVSLRTTLLVEYRRDGWRIGGEIYDSRAYSSTRGSAIGTSEVNAVEPVQAYIARSFIDPFGPSTKASVEAGRLTLNIGSRRLIAADDYRNTTNSYTGVRGDLTLKDGTRALVLFMLPQARLPDDRPSILDNEVHPDRESFDARLWGGLLTRPHALGETMAEIGYYRFVERDAPGRPTRNRRLHMIDARVLREPAAGRFDYEGEAIFQFGSIRSSTAATAAAFDVAAWFVHVDAGYGIAGPMHARVSIEYDRASGDRRGGRFGRFDTLFGMRRADLAPSGIYAQIGRANISTPGVRIEIAPSKRFDAFLSYRAMWLASRTDSFSTGGVRDATGASGSFAGQQAEARARLWLVPRILRGEINLEWIAKGRFLRDAPNAPRTGDTRYASAAMTAFF
jgi:hypothetical protein